MNKLLQYRLENLLHLAPRAQSSEDAAKNFEPGPGQAPGRFAQYTVRHEWFRPKPKQCLLVLSKVFRFVKKRTWHIRKVKFRYFFNNSENAVST